ncbi:methyltransferase domain-containing protein [Mycolicibacterium neoaurum]|uniref:class I SAM-dependent methyltransferase n=1 Tax=Mycolicibacterium neoaurum TaxID=1795 RepID=UPI0026733042|nr:class I SAM-dependent methyltransferase [Mycolicibacterium neoaurum]MDO3399920.1 methyltransferase domain-containing protein [Mycolicibacterium neoaurum]
MTDVLTHRLARYWVARWARCQDRYADYRVERTEVICDILASAIPAGSEPAVVLDLGCGPGDLTALLAERLPGTRVIGVDRDPFLVALGRVAYPGLEFQVADVVGADAAEVVSRWGAPAAIVASAVLHYPPAAQLRALVGVCARALRPGGVFVDADHMPPRHPGLRDIVTALAAESPNPSSDTWEAWWRATRSEPAFNRLLAERDRMLAPHTGDNDLSLEDRIAVLNESGLSAGPVWQRGRSVLLAGIRDGACARIE